jgi:ArsR family transcriptional regulator
MLIIEGYGLDTMKLDFETAMKALSHPARMEFLIWLRDPEKYFGLSAESAAHGVMAGKFEIGGMSQSAVSGHLHILLRAGFLTSRRIGQHVFYRRNEEAIAEFKGWLVDQI